MMHLKSGRGKNQRGQSIAEVMISLPFMMALVIGLVEMGITFASYIALVNGAREAAIFASGCTELTDPAKDDDPDYIHDCTNSEEKENIEEFVERVYFDVIHPVSLPLKEGQLQIEDSDCNGDSGDPFAYHNCVKIDRPVLGPSGGSCSPPTNVACPITVTLYYRVKTLTSNARLPYFGRFGLPAYYQLNYSMNVMIRGE